nr:HlyD family type I secretion periplasmic adaptor subunit [Vibrio sinus]
MSRIKAAGTSKQKSNEREFLPAALEILETPASPIGRGVAMLLALFFSLALIWAYFGHVDVNAVSQGKVVPKGGVKLVQPLEAGIVRDIYVSNGQYVEQGELLIALNSIENQVDLSQLGRQKEMAELNVRRVEQMLRRLDKGAAESQEEGELASVSDTPARWQQESSTYLNHANALENHQSARLQHQLMAYFSKKQGLQAQIAEVGSALQASLIEADKLTALLPVATEKASAMLRLATQKMAARLNWLELEGERITMQKNLEAEKQKVEQFRASRHRLQAELAQLQADVQSQLLAELIEAEDKVREAELSLRRFKQREAQRFLRAPVSGYVQQLATQTIGGVVQPAQQLAIIAPDKATLLVNAMVLNRDIGFVRTGQPVTLKVESYPYSKYGTLQGWVEYISHDAIDDEKMGPVYSARIRLAAQNTTHTGIQLPLQSGMAVTADIKTDQRRVIDYLLSPIKEVFSEAIRER